MSGFLQPYNHDSLPYSSQNEVFEVKKGPDGKSLPDAQLAEHAKRCAQACGGAQAGAFVAAISDETLKKTTKVACLVLLDKQLDSSTDKAYDVLKGFEMNCLGPELAARIFLAQQKALSGGAPSGLNPIT